MQPSSSTKVLDFSTRFRFLLFSPLKLWKTRGYSIKVTNKTTKKNRSLIYNKQSPILHDGKLNEEFYTFPFRGPALPHRQVMVIVCASLMFHCLWEVTYWAKICVHSATCFCWAVQAPWVKKTNRTRTLMEKTGRYWRAEGGIMGAHREGP